MGNHKGRYLAQGAMIAAMYAVLCHLQNFIFPNSANMMIQFRFAEALCVLAFFTKAAIPGLTIGCFVYNISFAGALPLDFLVGSLATLIAAWLMWQLRNVRLWRLPVPGLLMPALSNAILVGWELSAYIGGGFWLNALYVAIGETAVLLTLGTLLTLTLQKHRKHFSFVQEDRPL